MGRPSSFNQLPYDSGHYSFPHMFLQHTMEQDRASPVLVHHRQLARQTARQPSGHRPTDRRNNDDDRPQNALRTELDPNAYPAGIKVSDDEIEAVNLTRHDFHGEWNYTVCPKQPQPTR